MAAISSATLIAIERGWETPGQTTLAALLSTYGTSAEQILPPRTPLTIDGKLVALAHDSTAHVAASSARDDLLHGYIKLVTEARDTGSLDTLSLRSTDLQSIALALGTDDAILVERIAALLDCSLEEAVSIGRLLRTFAGPILGVAFSVTVIGGSILAGNTSGAQLLPASADTPPAPIVAAEFGATTPETTTSETTTLGISSTTTQPRHATSVESLPGESHAATVTSAAAVLSAPDSTTTTQTPDIGLLPGETPTLIFEG